MGGQWDGRRGPSGWAVCCSARPDSFRQAVYAAVVVASDSWRVASPGVGSADSARCYAPAKAHGGLLVAGLTLLPLAFWVLRRQRRVLGVLESVAAVVV